MKPYGPLRLSANSADQFAGAEPIVFVSTVPHDDQLITVTASGHVAVHRWFPLKPNGSGVPFTFECAAATLTRAEMIAGTPSAFGVSEDGKWLLSGGYHDGTLRATSLARPDLTVRARAHASRITIIHVGAERHTALSGSADHTLVLWSLYGGCGPATHARAVASPTPLHVLCGHAGPIQCAVLSTQLDLVLSASGPKRADGRADADVILWRAAKGRFSRRIMIGDASATAVAVSPTGSGLAVCAEKTAEKIAEIHLFSLNGRPLARVPLDAACHPAALVCTRDGELLVGSEGTRIAVRRLHDLKLLYAYDLPDTSAPRGGTSDTPPPRGARALSLSPENHHAFAGAPDSYCDNEHNTVIIIL